MTKIADKDKAIRLAYNRLVELDAHGLFEDDGTIPGCFIPIFMGWCVSGFENGFQVFHNAIGLYWEEHLIRKN